MPHLLDLSVEQFRDRLALQGEPPYRAAQVWRWLMARRAGSFEEMSDLSKALRSRLAAEWQLWSMQVVAQKTSDDGTEKLLLQTADAQQIECVLLRDDKDHRTICISTQVGCAMGCVFCASGLEGVVRNLTQGEIVEEMLQLQRLLAPEERLSHIVVMGMGEPLANLPRLLPALERAHRPDGLGIGARRITISTVGLPAGIRRLAEVGTPYHLAVSLHAPNDALRNELVPTNRRVGIGPILEASDDYFRVTGRRVTFEYVLLADVNDRPEHARQLAERLRGRTALVNVIPYNPVEGLPYRTPAAEVTARFVSILSGAGIAVKVRYRKGDRIEAACGQLRRRHSATHAS